MNWDSSLPPYCPFSSFHLPSSPFPPKGTDRSSTVDEIYSEKNIVMLISGVGKIRLDCSSILCTCEWK